MKNLEKKFRSDFGELYKGGGVFDIYWRFHLESVVCKNGFVAYVVEEHEWGSGTGIEYKHIVGVYRGSDGYTRDQEMEPWRDKYKSRNDKPWEYVRGAEIESIVEQTDCTKVVVAVKKGDSEEKSCIEKIIFKFERR